MIESPAVMGSKTHRNALGMIETRGLVGSLEASDAMVKSSTVILLGKEYVGGGHATVFCRGEVGAVKAALDAGALAAKKVGELLTVHMIAKPDSQIETLLPPPNWVWIPPWNPSGALRQLDPETLTVVELRKLARELPRVGLSGRDISKAGKDALVAAIRKATGMK